jgi:hypothetical protein
MSREGIESAERLIDQEDFGMSYLRPRQGNSLDHPTRKMMRMNIGKPAQPYDADEFVDSATSLAGHSQRHKTSLNVSSTRERREQVRVCWIH